MVCELYIFFKINLFILFIYFWLHWVFVSVRGLSLAVASGGHSSLRCAGLSLSRPLVAANGGYSVAVHELLIVVASLVAEHGL